MQRKKATYYPDWKCFCPGDKEVFGSKAACVRCKANRPSHGGVATRDSSVPARRTTDWDCPSCTRTFIFGSKSACPGCGAAKPSAAAVTKPPLERRDGDWDCKKCASGRVNFAATLACQTCGAIKPPVDQDAPDGKPTCCICLTAEPIMAAVPCGHAAYCYECSATMMNAEKPCGLCRLPVSSFIRVHLV